MGNAIQNIEIKMLAGWKIICNIVKMAFYELKTLSETLQLEDLQVQRLFICNKQIDS